jgi:hypothetical protein
MSAQTPAQIQSLPNWITTILACVIAVVTIVNADNSNHNNSKDALAVIESKLDISTLILQNLQSSNNKLELAVGVITEKYNGHEIRITVLESKVKTKSTSSSDPNDD